MNDARADVVDDLEGRLRATYRAVADRTVVDTEHPPLHAVGATPLSTRPSHRRALVAIGVAASLLVALVAVLATRHPAQPATGADKAQRTVAIPISVPQGFAYLWASNTGGGEMAGFTGRFAFTTINYRRGTAQITVTSAARSGARPAAGDHSLALLSGVTATVSLHAGASPSFTSVAWAQPSGVIVSITATGVTETDLVQMANSIWYVTPALFDTLTAHGGFARISATEHLFDGWRMPGDRFAEDVIGVMGSLQTGLRITWANANLGFTAVVGTCRIAPITDNSRLVLVGPGTTRAFVRARSDGTVQHVPAGAPPGLPTMAVAGVKGSSPPDGSLTCVGGTP